MRSMIVCVCVINCVMRIIDNANQVTCSDQLWGQNLTVPEQCLWIEDRSQCKYTEIKLFPTLIALCLVSLYLQVNQI